MDDPINESAGTNDPKAKFLDGQGRYLTQSLFLEIHYSDDAIYTMKDDDFEYKGRFLKSIKKLYLETEDPTEYEFARLYFASWKQWVRICENKVIFNYIREWRDELEVKLRSRAVREQIALAKKGNYNASKWVADRSWDTRGAGRPTKAQVQQEARVQAAMSGEYEEDVKRLKLING